MHIRQAVSDDLDSLVPLLEGYRAHCEAARVGEMRLATQVDNHAAKTLYESLGWQRVTGFDYYTLVLA